MKTDDPFSLLYEKLIHAGLSVEQAKEYVWFAHGWYASDIKLGILKTEDILPSNECLNTLAEAHKIITESAMNKANPRTLHPAQIRQYLSVPDSQWKAAKASIAKFFGVTESKVNALYNADEAWLHKSSEDCLDAALYTNYICRGDSQLSWKVFRNTGLLGRKETEKRVNQLYDLLGPEDSTNLIMVDADSGHWLFCKEVSVRCIAYLKQCGLSNNQISEFVSRYGYVLYLFNSSKMLARIDSIIHTFLCEWQQNFGPCYDGLTQEEINFLIHGPGKVEA